MTGYELSAQTLFDALLSGCHKLIEQRQELNQINVFPVADGDTGDNMAAVCTAVIEFARVHEQVKPTLESIATAAIIGSRGNSGILLSQFFIALSHRCPIKTSVSISDWCDALHYTGEQISSVLAHPLEGTIITLIKKCGELAEANKDKPILELMRIITLSLEEEVQLTTTKLELLKEHQVVDAGALGFYYFMIGFSDYLECGSSTNSHDRVPSYQQIPHLHTEEPTECRYCTEVVLKKASITREELLIQLEQQGGSAAVIGTEDVLKIHLHTNKPQALFNTLYPLGTLKYPKVDDMKRQYELRANRKHRIALVTDSSADLPQELLDNYQIHIIPLNIHIGEHDVLDKYSFETTDFYKQLQHVTHYPKTSCASPHKVKHYLNTLRHHYDKILILSISSAMSGMYSAFVEASKGEEQVCVLDTKTNSAAHGLLLNYAGQLIAENLPFEDIVHRMHEAINTTYIFVLVNQYDSMIRSGRMNKHIARFASWTQIKPIVSIDNSGRGVIAGSALSTRNGLKQLLHCVQKKLQKDNARLEDYCIVHADNTEASLQLAKLSQAQFNKEPLFIDTVSLAIGLHAGRGCVAIAARIVGSAKKH